MRSAEDTVRLQLHCYNNHDLDGFVATYDDDVIIYNLIDNSIILEGKTALRERYRERFDVLKAHAELKNRITIGNKVIDYENVTTLANDNILEAVVIYEVQNDLIKHAWFVYE